MTIIESNSKRQKCIHHWIIESSNDSTSNGRCKKCGEVATFLNGQSNAVINRPISDEFVDVVDELIKQSKRR